MSNTLLEEVLQDTEQAYDGTESEDRLYFVLGDENSCSLETDGDGNIVFTISGLQDYSVKLTNDYAEEFRQWLGRVRRLLDSCDVLLKLRIDGIIKEDVGPICDLIDSKNPEYVES